MRFDSSHRTSSPPAVWSHVHRVSWNCACRGLVAGPGQAFESSFSFIPGDLLVSSSTYVGTAATVVVGQTLPPNDTLSGAVKATNNGTYPNVFLNANVDGSFGVTSPIILRQYSLSRDYRSAHLDNILNVTDRTGIVTSFSSKSELSLNLSTSRRALTFTGYNAPVNTLDVSNSNTPNHVDPTNQVPASYQRAIVQTPCGDEEDFRCSDRP